MIKDLTIVVIDSLNYDATVMALDQTKKIFPDAKVLIFSDKNFYPCDTFVEVRKFNGHGHSHICLHEVPKYVDTNWALYIQYDGFPTQAHLWDDRFLDYDYIGAEMWDRNQQSVVGNGGLSLRSKKLLDLQIHLKQDIEGEHWDWLEDQLISFKYRNWLESQGVTYAPLELARKWSKDFPQGSPDTFGFHAHNLIPEYCSKEFTLEWLNKIDDSVFKSKNLFCIPYYLWQWGELDLLRNFMLRAIEVRPDWTKECWDDCRWRIGTVYTEVELWEIQKMIYIYGYTGP